MGSLVKSHRARQEQREGVLGPTGKPGVPEELGRMTTATGGALRSGVPSLRPAKQTNWLIFMGLYLDSMCEAGSLFPPRRDVVAPPTIIPHLIDSPQSTDRESVSSLSISSISPFDNGGDGEGAGIQGPPNPPNVKSLDPQLPHHGQTHSTQSTRTRRINSERGEVQGDQGISVFNRILDLNDFTSTSEPQCALANYLPRSANDCCLACLLWSCVFLCVCVVVG